MLSILKNTTKYKNKLHICYKGQHPDDEREVSRSEMIFFNIGIHILNIIYVLFDLFVTGVPIRLLHVWMPMAFFTFYTCVYIVIWHFTGYHAYPELEPNFSGFVISAVLVNILVVVPVCQFVLFCLQILKLKIYRFCTTKTYHIEKESHNEHVNISYIA